MSPRSTTFTSTTASCNSELAMRPFERSLPMALLRAREAAMAKFRPLLGEHDLTEQQWRVLRALAAASQPLTVGQIVDATTLLAPSLSRILANLEARGLVDRSVAQADQRRSLLVLSSDGQALVQQIAPKSEAAYNDIEAQFGGDRLASLLAELQAFARLADADADADTRFEATA